MFKKLSQLTVLTAVLSLMLAIPATAQEEPTIDEQIAGLEELFASTAEARAQRQADDPLYNRLGGIEKIHLLTKEIVRLHLINEDINQDVMKIDLDHLAKQVAIFIAAGTGGPQEYHGRSMKKAHAHLNVTKASFLAAGHDVMQAMKNLDYGPEEIEEVVCILVSMKDEMIVD